MIVLSDLLDLLLALGIKSADLDELLFRMTRYDLKQLEKRLKGRYGGL